MSVLEGLVVGVLNTIAIVVSLLILLLFLVWFTEAVSIHKGRMRFTEASPGGRWLYMAIFKDGDGGGYA